MSDMWPKQFLCFCGKGHQWWQIEQKRYACNAPGCGIVMTEDPNDGAIGVWNGQGPGQPKLTRMQTWAKAPPDTEDTDLR